MNKLKINSFDLDGVITVGLYPGPNDVIITGRSYEEAPETYRYLHSKGIYNAVYFNPLPFDKKTRESSGFHKANIIDHLRRNGNPVEFHYDDDCVQIEVIKNAFGDTLKIVHINHDFTEKENIRHDEFGQPIR